MRKLLVTSVLALAVLALLRGASPAFATTAQQGSNVPTSQKVIKDPAEYNAYISALNLTNPAAKGAAMEAFITSYPNSIVKIDAMEQAMGAYQQATNQQKVLQLARQILQLEPNNVRALAIVVFVERFQVNDVASGAKVRAEAERGLQELDKWKQPEGVSAAEYDAMRKAMKNIFAGTAGFGALQQQDFAAARKYYEQALKIDPNDLGNNYQIAIALLQPNPLDALGFWYGAKALSLAQQQNPQAFQAWAPYFRAKYQKYHGNAEDWTQRIAAAGPQTAPPAGFVAGISLAPTPCDIAAMAVQQNGADGLSFSDWELVLSCHDKTPANKVAADQVWQAIQKKQKFGDARLSIPVKVVAVPNPSTLEVAVAEDSQAANKTDMKVTLEKPLAKPPAPGTEINVIGVISEYIPEPFMFILTKGAVPAGAAR
ncbi:MAG TPA: tetratricopeptide repeat protein [Terriglobales bacterium]|nr:tetratricopeptide repeat protein [Terriglobales bacterium]